jgi:hypothetical protein
MSYGLWMRRFGGARDILGRKILVNGQFSASRVGALPDGRRQAEAGRHLSQAQSELEAIAAQLAKQFPQRDMDHGK